MPRGYHIHTIDERIYETCLKEDFTKDFVSAFDNKEDYLTKGRGIVIMKDDEIVAGASSYTRYKEGIEMEVDTKMEERRKNLALVASVKLILDCLEEGLYPSWDAQNKISLHLAEKFGYIFSHEYCAYEIF